MISDNDECSDTVPTFDSCTKCMGSPGIINDHTSDYHPVSWARMTLQLNEALVRKLRGSLMCLACFDMLSISVFYNQSLAVVRSTVAGIRFCTVDCGLL